MIKFTDAFESLIVISAVFLAALLYPLQIIASTLAYWAIYTYFSVFEPTNSAEKDRLLEEMPL